MNNLFIQQAFKIIHVDMDCFYAQVEMRDNPSLEGRPVAIGGPSKTQGVLCTSNYEARKFGVKAAQSTFKAFQLCPDLILIPPDFSKYEEVSRIVKKIYLSFSDRVQPVSLDEAYIDVSDCRQHNGSATLIAQEIKQEIVKQTGLTASAGVSFNKMLAKIASDWHKPDGLFVITPDMRENFMQDLPLSKIPGIGKVSDEKYKTLGFKTCGDITQRDVFELIGLLGKKTALDLYKSCQGISNSTVKNRRQKKSFGIEKTFFNSIEEKSMDKEITLLLDKYNDRFKRLSQFHLDCREISHLSIKIRLSDFSTYTREFAIARSHSDIIISSCQLDDEAREKIRSLFHAMCQIYRQPVRLIGLGVRFKERSHEQLDFDWK